MKIREIIEATGGRLVSGDPGEEISPASIRTDSRALKSGDVFLALKGPNFDGADFLGAAFEKGAKGAVVSRLPKSAPCGDKIIIKVEDTTKGLQAIASAHRVKFNIPVIAVTGSNGKTTVKEMIWRLLSARYRVLKNEGTFNNHIGVTKTLLGLKKYHDICVVELGANHEGEIRALAEIVRPSIAVITNIGPSHLEFFGGLEGVFRAKKEILEDLDKKEGLLVVNGDDRYLAKIRRKRRILRFGLSGDNDFRAEAVSVDKGKISFMLNGKDRFELNLLGLHNVYNALAAIAVAEAFNVTHGLIKKALLNYRPASMRLNISRINGIGIINDSYNSNPLSMEHALETLKNYPAHARWVVAGDMLELGKDARRFHEEAGDRIAESGADGLMVFGKLSEYTLSHAGERGMDRNRLWRCETHDEIADILRRVASQGDVVLIKGSRGMRMEEVVSKFRDKGRKKG